jgi:ABC-type bacteriocin/lantibiotic exporter with double-glycine peptidase domain
MGGAIKGGTVAAQGGAEASEAQNIATNAIKAGNGEGIFPSSDIKPYNPSNVVYGQLNDASCVAGSCRMAIAPQLGDVPEAYIRSAIGTSSDGTSLSNVPQGLRDLGFDGSVNYVTDAGAQSVSSATQNGSTVIVNVKSPLGDIHAVVVDSVVDGRVYIRDPWPPGTGSAYSVSAESFNNSMTGSAVIIKGK